MKLCVLLVAAALLALPTLTNAQTAFDLEHFRCYPVLKIDPIITATVGLRDQFDPAGAAPEIVDVGRAFRFCNPTRKFHNGQFFGVADIRQHLTLYKTFPQSSPLKIVNISNQFGQQQSLRVRDGVALAVPTQKQPHDAPQGLDHFRCYAANGNLIAQPAALSDQFMTPFTGHFILDPLLFCNPVQKTHGTIVTPIQHPDVHLTCYSMTRVTFTREVAIRNQFGDQRLVVGPPDILCVPTRKLSWQQIPDANPGAGIQNLPLPE